MTKMRLLLCSLVCVCLASAAVASPTAANGEVEESATNAEGLLSAADAGDVQALEDLLDRGSEIDQRNQSGNTALHLAIFRGHAGIVDILIQRGADVTVKDKGGFAPLDWAAANGLEPIAVKLLNAGADVGSKDLLGNTALSWASANGHIGVVETLLARGADPANANADGETPLHLAAANGELEVCALLADRGAPVDARDNDGETPIQVAAAQYYSEIVELLHFISADGAPVPVPDEASDDPQTGSSLQPSRLTKKSRILDGIRRNGGIVIGYRQAAVPFSYLGPDGVPIGYSIDLCREIVSAIRAALGSEDLPVRWLPVSPATRLTAIDSGEVELDCGVTTHTLSRRELAEFSPTTFVTGTQLLVKAGSGIQGLRDLDGRKVALLSATTNAKAIAKAVKTTGIEIEPVSVQDHPAGFRAVANGEAHAYAADHILLHALVRDAKNPEAYRIVGEFLSYDPYAIGLPRNDSTYALLIDRTLSRLFRSGDIKKIYAKWFGPLEVPMPEQLTAAFRLQALPE